MLYQRSANCGPRAKCSPRRQNLWPTRYISARNILVKNKRKKCFCGKNLQQELILVKTYYQCCFIASFFLVFSLNNIFVLFVTTIFYKLQDANFFFLVYCGSRANCYRKSCPLLI